MKNQTVAKERRPIAFGLALVVLLIWAALLRLFARVAARGEHRIEGCFRDRPESAASRGGDLI